jgi:hypothetical protein
LAGSAAEGSRMVKVRIPTRYADGGRTGAGGCGGEDWFRCPACPGRVLAVTGEADWRELDGELPPESPITAAKTTTAASASAASRRRRAGFGRRGGRRVGTGRPGGRRERSRGGDEREALTRDL